MLNGTFFATLIGLTITVLAIWYSNFGNDNIEPFIDVPRTVRVMPLEQTHQGQFALSPQQEVSYNKRGSSDMFMVPGTMQNSLSPRMDSSNNYGSHIRYNFPSMKHQAVPKDPLTFGDMVQEGYSSGSGGGCGARAHATDKETSWEEARNSLSSENIVSELPVPDMTMLNSEGNVENPLILDRFIVANQKSRLHSLGDYIRGDLAIAAPVGNWFTVSVQPHIDLNSGAMAVLGGMDNDTSRDLYELQYRSSGGQDKTLGGVDVMNTSMNTSMNFSAQKQGYQGYATNDIEFTAFP